MRYEELRGDDAVNGEELRRDTAATVGSRRSSDGHVESKRFDFRSSYAFAIATAVVSALVFIPLSRYLIDDSFITLSYARNFAFHGEWALIRGSVSNTATSPLNVLLLSALTLLVRDAVLACGILFVACCVLIVVAFRRLCIVTGTPIAFAPAAAILTVVNPVVSSSVGLEVLLGTALLAWVAVLAVEHSAVALGVASGLVLVARLDLAIVAAALVAIRRSPFRRLWLTLAVAVATALPWFLCSWLFLGSVVPDTVVIKTEQGAWGDWEFLNGIGLYFSAYPAATVLAVVLPVLGVVLLLISSFIRSWTIPVVFYAWGIGGVAYYVAYSFLQVPPYHWYYGAPIVAGTVGFVGIVFSSTTAWRNVGVGVCSVIFASSVTLWVWTGLKDGVVPITTNHATAAQYAKVGQDLPAITAGDAILTGGEIGALAYFCDCPVVDTFSDRGALAEDLVAKREDPGIAGRLWTLNFRNLELQSALQLQYKLVRVPVGEIGPDSIATWPVTSPWTGKSTLHLVVDPGASAN